MIDAADGKLVKQDGPAAKAITMPRPLAGDGKVFLPGNGVATVFKAGPRIEVLSSHDFGERIAATQVISDQTIYVRTEKAVRVHESLTRQRGMPSCRRSTKRCNSRSNAIRRGPWVRPRGLPANPGDRSVPRIGFASVGRDRAAGGATIERSRRFARRLQSILARPFFMAILAMPGGAASSTRLACNDELPRLNPDLCEAHNNRGLALQSQGLVGPAVESFRRALQIRPDDVEANCNYGRVLLLQGDYDRRSAPKCLAVANASHPSPPFAMPAWDGSPLPEQHLILSAEQGLGDTLQFIRYVPLVRSRVAGLTVQVQPAPIPLLAESGYEVVPLAGFSPHGHFHCSMLSLPELLGTTLATVPCDVPYLRAEPNLVERWRQVLGGIEVGRSGSHGRGIGPFGATCCADSAGRVWAVGRGARRSLDQLAERRRQRTIGDHRRTDSTCSSWPRRSTRRRGRSWTPRR